MDLPRNRRACDRCHTQKLSCKRQGDTESCIRCTRASINCVFSPSKKRGKPDYLDKGPAPKKSSSNDRVTLNTSLVSEGESLLESTEPIKSPKKGLPAMPSATTKRSGFHVISRDVLARCGWADPESQRSSSTGPQDNSYLSNTSGLDMGLMLDNDLDDALILESSAFEDGSRANAFSISTPAFTFDDSFATSETIFSAGSPDLCSFETPVSSVFDVDNTGSQSSSISSQSVGGENPTNSLKYDVLCSGSPIDISDWFRDPDWLGNMSDLPLKADQPLDVDMFTWMTKLAELNSELFKRAEQMARVNLNEQSLQPDPVFAVDQIFCLSQQLLDLLNQVHPRFTRVPSRSSTMSSVSSWSSSSTGPSSEKHHTHSKTSLDPGTILLAISCKVRLLEIYENLFYHVERWISDHDSPNPLLDIHFPGLNIGAFSLDSSSGLQVSVVIQLIEQLLGRLHNITLSMDISIATQEILPESALQDAKSESSTLSEVANVALHALKKRESKTMVETSRIKQLLEVSGIM